MTRTATNERGLICTADEVRAILNGATQFRRVIEPQPDTIWNVTSAGVLTSHSKHNGEWSWLSGDPHDSDTWGVCGDSFRCPYGVPGDRLWVRETFWCENDTCDHEYCSGCDMGSMLSFGKGYARVDYCATPRCEQHPKLNNQQTVIPYRGDAMPGDWFPVPSDQWDGMGDGNDNIEREGVFEFSPWRFYTKHPSIHMPRWASRITLKVKRVWVERVQEISEADAIAEGVYEHDLSDYRENKICRRRMAAYKRGETSTPNDMGAAARFRFAELWDSINASKGYGWDTNPWVWCVEFERVEVSA